ncbi:MAG TPA: hypothetical protein VLG11_00840 [Candidatus Saccharimonadales bacterium]|nr:hypothetical protein [Candidatus Saccharimonadales bacterium]
MRISGENVGFTGLEVNWADQSPQWCDPSLRGLVQRIQIIRLQQSLEIGGLKHISQETVQHALKRDGMLTDEFDQLAFRVGWLKIYLGELRTAETEPLVVHTTAEPLELRATYGIRHAIDQHFGDGPLPFSSAP